MKDDADLKKFTARLEDAFDYFEKFKQLPVVLINDEGEYIISGAPGKKGAEPAKAMSSRPPGKHRTRIITGMPESVHEWPKYPGGPESYMKYLQNLGKDMVGHLPTGTQKAYVQVEFIVDRDGVPVNFKVLRGVNDEDFIEEIITRMEKMPQWQPAVLNDKPVPKKMVQTIAIELPEPAREL
jgi:hypothetical protein